MPLSQVIAHGVPSTGQTALACLPKSHTGSTHRPAVVFSARALHAKLTGGNRSPDSGCSRHLEPSKLTVTNKRVSEGQGYRCRLRRSEGLQWEQCAVCGSVPGGPGAQRSGKDWNWTGHQEAVFLHAGCFRDDDGVAVTWKHVL